MICLKPLTRIPAWVQWTKSRFNVTDITEQCTACSLMRKTSQIVTINCRQFGILSDPENKGQRQTGVNFETLGSWNNKLEMQISEKKSIEKGKLIPEIPLDEIGTASLLGRRKVNEDRFTTQALSEDLLYFAIFDGHGGSQAVDHVHVSMMNSIKFWLTQTHDLDIVLKQSFVDVNNLLARQIFYHNLTESGFCTGTTATVCLLRNNIELVVGHVGDTRAILCRNGDAVRLTTDDAPDVQEEIDRIKKNGGNISDNSLGVAHVNGRLTMTRSIGDMQLKQYGVVPHPHIRSIEVKHGKDSFLLLCSDGLNFVMSDQECADIITSCSNPTEAAFFVTDQALQFGSEDNCSAVVIPFGAWGKYRRTTRAIPYSFGRNFSSNRYS